MHSRKTVPIPDLMSAANMELIRLDFKSSTLSRHSKEFRSFSNYCRENEITAYDAETGPQYFQHCYGLDIGNSTAKLTKQQLDTRCSIRFLDDIFQFGYALRYSHHDYTVPRQYVHVLLGKHADTGNVVRNQTAHAGDSAVLTSMYSAMRRS